MWKVEDEEEEDDEGRLEEATELLNLIRDNMEANNGRLDDQLLVRLYRNKITSKPALNQGVIMDGFPKTYEQVDDLWLFKKLKLWIFQLEIIQAKMLYEAQEDEDGEPQGQADPATIPELVIDLTATEEFLKQRMMNHPEEEVQGTHNTEEGFLRRLSTFIANRSEEDTGKLLLLF